jgi:hypothetical protein
VVCQHLYLLPPHRHTFLGLDINVCWEQGVKLSEKEQRELDYKIQVYELAKKRKDQETALQNRDEYRMPDSYDADGQVNQDERMKLLSRRFE